MLRASRPTRLGDTKLPCDVAHASVVCPGGSIAHISGDKPLLLCQGKRPREHKALMSGIRTWEQSVRSTLPLRTIILASSAPLHYSPWETWKAQRAFPLV